ncbi:MAG: Gfo/Idh/MocA family oxidoreductase [Planctomycetes bacterium]|nr:Gfo/Idh/MocA family oxidoreductase [Planctomycetota bacterium]
MNCRSLAAGLLLVCGWMHATQGAEPVRVGILGFDNYQAVEYAAFFNNPKAEGDLAGLRVTAAYPAISPDYPESAVLTARWQQQMLDQYKDNPAAPRVEIVGSVNDLLAKCDAVMIWSLDGRLHLEQARAVIAARKRLFIGRPLTATPPDAVALFKLAAEAKVPLWSCSQHRFSPGFSGMRNHPEVGKVLGCDVYGGYAVSAPPADEFSRALHSIETLYTIMGPGVQKLSCVSTPAAESITAVWGDGRVGTYRGVKQGAVKYSATVFGEQGVSTAGIYGHGVPVKGVVPTDDKYMGYGGLAIELAKFFKGGEPPVTAAETLEIFAFLQAAEESRANHGAMVKLKNLLDSTEP